MMTMEPDFTTAAPGEMYDDGDPMFVQEDDEAELNRDQEFQEFCSDRMYQSVVVQDDFAVVFGVQEHLSSC